MTENTSIVYINDYTGETFDDDAECRESERQYLFGDDEDFFAIDNEGDKCSIADAIDEWESSLLNPCYAAALVFKNQECAIDFLNTWEDYWDNENHTNAIPFNPGDIHAVNNGSPIVFVSLPFKDSEYPYILKSRAEKIVKKIQDNLLAVEKFFK